MNNQSTDARKRRIRIMNGNNQCLEIILSKQSQQTMKQSSSEPIFRFIHFNDVYDIQPKKNGTAGIVNFEAYIRQLKKQYPEILVLFSGDAFSPSILTNIYNGKQMVVGLNKLNIDVACMGNHQFDLERDQTLALFKQTNFPWLQGNLKYIQSGELLGGGMTHYVKEVNGRRIGFYGVAGEDWLGILGQEYEDQLVYEDVNEFSQKFCKILREEEKCEIVVGLTHMRVPQDSQLPEKSEGVDLILGGHDHIFMEQFINEIPVVKSGSNFRHLSIIQVFEKGINPQAKYKGRRFDFNIELKEVPIFEKDIDEELKQYVEECMTEYQKYDRLVGFTAVPLETRFSKVRSEETNYGNFFADLIRNYFDTDCCMINSGSIRHDTLVKPGKLNFSMVSNIINDVLVVKLVPGSKILEALEYSVSSLPECFAGHFLLVSGIRYTFDWRLTPRVQEVSINGEPLDLDRQYTVCSFNYLSGGGDGFSMMRQCPFLIDPTKGIDALSLILKFFKASDVNYDNEKMEGFLKQKKQKKQEKLEVPKKQEQKGQGQEQDEIQVPQQMLVLTKKKSSRLERLSKIRRKLITTSDGKKYVSIAPKLDGRIVCLSPNENDEGEGEGEE